LSPGPLSFGRSKPCRVASLVLPEGDFPAARDLGQGFIDAASRPRQIVAFLKRSFGGRSDDESP